MKILTSSNSLDLSGVPTFTLTMYRELVKRGHKMTVYSPLGGKLEELLPTVRNLKDITPPDVIIAQHKNCAEDLKKAFPDTFFIYYAHGVVPEVEQPPDFQADLYFAINEEVKNNLIAKKVTPEKIEIVRDFIDTKRFKPTSPINKKLKNVLFVSNYKKWKNFKAVSGACQKLGVNLVCSGAPYHRNYEIEKAINASDLVISWARGILEGMSCGRAVLSFDRYEGDGYIDERSYLLAREDNFSGRIYKIPFDADSLASEMQKYDASCGEINRNLILKYHDVGCGVDRILDLINGHN